MKTQDGKTQDPRPGSPGKAGVIHRIRNAVRSAVTALNYRVHVAAANLWRDQYNPLRGLTMQRAVVLLEEGERGAYADLMWTYRFIEKRDAVLGSLIDSRSSALEEMDWDIKVSDRARTPEEKSLADRQATRLKEVYEGIANLQDAIQFLALASFRGYSHLEVVRNADGDIVELLKVEQWHWVREGLSGSWEYNPESRLGINRGEAVPMERFITREVERPINEVALICFLRKSLSQKDWDAFVETYGIPPMFVIMPPELGEGQREEFQEIAEEVIGDSRGVLPGNSDVKTIDNGARGANPFRDHIKYQDEQLVLRGTGGKLTMLTESGSGTLAGSAHMAAFDRIAAAEAKKISELLRATIDAAVLQSEFPGQPVFAGFAIAENEETDTSAIVKDAAALSGAGYLVDDAWLEEKTGYKLAKAAPAPVANSKSPIANRQIRNREEEPASNLLSAAAGLIEEARLEDHAGLVDGLRAALALDDDEAMQTALQEWYDELPEEVGNTPAMEAAWEKVLAVALASGLETEDEETEARREEIRNSGGYDPNQLRIPKGNPGGGRWLLGLGKQAVAFAKKAVDPSFTGKLELGLVPEAVAAMAGEAFEGRNVVFTLDAESVRHRKREHSDAKAEADRGQKTFDPEDYRRLPEALHFADSIEPGNVTERNPRPFVFKKQFDDGKLIAVTAARKAKGGRPMPEFTVVSLVVTDQSSQKKQGSDADG